MKGVGLGLCVGVIHTRQYLKLPRTWKRRSKGQEVRLETHQHLSGKAEPSVEAEVSQRQGGK